MMGLFVVARSAAQIRRLGSATVRRTGRNCLVGSLCALFVGGLSLQARSADLYQAVTSDDRLALFSGAIEQAGLAEMLRGPGPLTLFVPSDQAMINEGSAFLLDRVLLTEANADRLADLVLHHAVPARRLTPDQLNGVDLPTLADVPLHVDRRGDALVVHGWAVVTDSQVADNGIIYVVDRLLWPRDWQSDRNLTVRLTTAGD